MLAALLDFAFALAPGVLALFVGTAIWPSTRRLRRLERLCDVRAKVVPGSGAETLLDEAIEAISSRVLRDTVGAAGKALPSWKRWLVPGAVVAIMLSAAAVAVYAGLTGLPGAGRGEVVGLVGLLASLLGLGASFLSSRASVRAVEEADWSSAIQALNDAVAEDEPR